MSDLHVANEIRRQLGQALPMLGATQLVGDHNSLQFAIKGSKQVNKIRITLTTQDLYTIEFFKIGKTPNFNVQNVGKVENIYNDQLHEAIENHTGLYTRT